MERFCTHCEKITSCNISPMIKEAPESVGNGKFNYHSTTKCIECGGDSVYYKPA